MKIIELFRSPSGGRTMAKALCPACKEIVVRQIYNAKRQVTCGCRRKELRGSKHYLFRHGKTPPSLYRKWMAIHERCEDKGHVGYHRYGGRGIKVCRQWDSFVVFRKWALSNGWKPGLEIDRRNNDGDYRPGNCRFVTRAKNCQNRSNNKLNEVSVKEIRRRSRSGEIAKSIAKDFGVSINMIYKIRNGKSWK